MAIYKKYLDLRMYVINPVRLVAYENWLGCKRWRNIDFQV